MEVRTLLRARRSGIAYPNSVSSLWQPRTVETCSRLRRTPAPCRRMSYWRTGRCPERRIYRRPHLRAVAKDPVAGYSDVVGGWRPCDVDLAVGDPGSRNPGRGGRRLCVRAGADGRVHVGLDLRLRERGVVDADLVDGAGEVLPVDAVAADLELVGRRGDAAGGCRARDLRPIHEQPDRGAVVGGCQVRERVRGDRDRAERLPVHARDRCPANGSGSAPGTGGRHQVVVVVALVDHVAP